jgi:hypothetical protein
MEEKNQRMTLEEYTRKWLHRRFYPYQMEIANAVLDSVYEGKGLTFSILLARQMGKNEISALIESYLLGCMEGGTIVKAAPTHKPQIMNSRLRLLSMLERSKVAQDRIWRTQGYVVGVRAPFDSFDSQTGPRIIFLSANPDAHIVGATASLLLEVDEAQDVSVEKFNRDLRPMASTTNATTVLYGTAWSDDTLLAQVKAVNEELEAVDGIRRHFEYDWRTLAALNPHYKAYVENEIQRLGEDHQTIRTQYRLQTISGAGFLLSERQRHLLRGKHHWLHDPDKNEDGGHFVMGIDVGGEARQRPGVREALWKRDSTVVTIARVSLNDLNLPNLQIVHQVQWTGRPCIEQYAQCVELCEQWEIHRLVIDKTGLGEGLASLLVTKLGEDTVIPFHFTRQSKSKLAYHMLSLIDSGRLKMYKEEDAPDDISIEAWKQLKLARYRVPGENLLDMYVSTEEGHDDYLISIALCCEATREWTRPYLESVIIRPRMRYYGDEWY